MKCDTKIEHALEGVAVIATDADTKIKLCTILNTSTSDTQTTGLVR